MGITAEAKTAMLRVRCTPALAHDLERAARMDGSTASEALRDLAAGYVAARLGPEHVDAPERLAAGLQGVHAPSEQEERIREP
jgi:hypothetical protein